MEKKPHNIFKFNLYENKILHNVHDESTVGHLAPAVDLVVWGVVEQPCCCPDLTGVCRVGRQWHNSCIQT